MFLWRWFSVACQFYPVLARAEPTSAPAAALPVGITRSACQGGFKDGLSPREARSPRPRALTRSPKIFRQLHRVRHCYRLVSCTDLAPIGFAVRPRSAGDLQVITIAGVKTATARIGTRANAAFPAALSLWFRQSHLPRLAFGTGLQPSRTKTVSASGPSVFLLDPASRRSGPFLSKPKQEDQTDAAHFR